MLRMVWNADSLVIGNLGGRHLAAGLSTLAQRVGTDLAVLGIVALTLFSTLLTGPCADLGKVTAVVRVAHHEPSVKRREVSDVATEAQTFSHLLAFTGTLISAPLARLSSL